MQVLELETRIGRAPGSAKNRSRMGNLLPTCDSAVAVEIARTDRACPLHFAMDVVVEHEVADYQDLGFHCSITHGLCRATAAINLARKAAKSV